jgi:hypothetical protein
LGGSATDWARAIAIDASNNAYLTGFTSSSDFPTTPGAYDTSYGAGTAGDAYVSKLNPGTSGAASMVYSTFLGVTGGGAGTAIALDTANNAYVTGYDYPASGGTSGTAQSNVFVYKLATNGGALVYSVVLGGTAGDFGYGVAVDSTGCAYVAGITASTNFPIANGAFEVVQHPGNYPFVLKLGSDGIPFWSTYLGGGGDDRAYGIALDSSQNVYVTGYTYSTDFPTIPGSYDRRRGGLTDAFVSKFSQDGVVLIYSTYLGGTAGADYGFGIAVDSNGNPYVTGRTESSDFPTTPGGFRTSYGGNGDAFVTKLATNGAALGYSTFLGDTQSEYGYGIAVDAQGYAYATGVTASSNFPTTTGAFQRTYGGGTSGDAFVSKLNTSGTGLVYSTFLGGASGDYGKGIAVDAGGYAYVTGYTYSAPPGTAGFPVTPGAYQTTYKGAGDAFVTKLNTGGTALVYSTLLGGTAGDLANGIAVDPNGYAYVTGQTYSLTSGTSGFPITPGAFQTAGAGVSDAFITKLGTAGNALAYSTFLGGSAGDFGNGIAVDSSGYAYVTGWTASANFPTTSFAYDAPPL